jgi:FMN phosphatase YigB (HAD superfamily)
MMAHSRRLVIWDVGGTLVDRVMGREEFVARALAAVGARRELLDVSAFRRAGEHYLASEPRWRTLGDEEQGLREVAGLLLEGSEAASDGEKIARLARALLGGYDIYGPVPGIPALLEELAAHGIRQAVVSNWPPSLRLFLAHHDLARYFALIAGSGEEGIQKPDVLLCRGALDRLGVEPARAVFIGNDPALDIAPAREIGLQTVHFDPRRQHPTADAQDAPTLRALLLPLLGLPV